MLKGSGSHDLKVTVYYITVIFSVILLNSHGHNQPSLLDNTKVENKDNLCELETEINGKHSSFFYKQKKKYILYNVNPGEGFNLRRDVYMRIAGMVRKLIREKPSLQWVLVLPPWGPLYHWEINNRDSKPQMKIPWSTFFDIESLSFYVPVMEFTEYLKEQGPVIDVVYYLQQDEWIEDEEWKEKIAIDDCKSETPYYQSKDGFSAPFWGYKQVQAKDFHCVTTQGYASSLEKLIEGNFVSVMIDRAEVVLHDNFGDSDYWAARRSMRFSTHLRAIGDDFRRKFLNSTDEKDKTIVLADWREMKSKHGLAKGGPYLAVHLRRRDFAQSRSKDVPNIQHAITQIKALQNKLNLTKIFVASDATNDEIVELQNNLPGMIKYIPNTSDFSEAFHGSVAIVDQWICAHARYFIGTYESTFSFRIQEEREILGFLPSATFNRLCGAGQMTCKQPSQWKITY